MEDKEFDEKLNQALLQIDSDASSEDQPRRTSQKDLAKLEYGCFADQFEQTVQDTGMKRRISGPSRLQKIDEEDDSNEIVINEAKLNKIKLYSHDALFQENKKLKSRVLDLETQLLRNKPVWVYEREIMQLREQLKKAIKKGAQVQQALVERDNQMGRIAKMIGTVVSGLTQGQFDLQMMRVDQNDEIEAENQFTKNEAELSKTKQISCDIWDQSVEIMQQAIQALLDRLWNLEKRNRDMGDEQTKGSNVSRRHARLRMMEMENARHEQTGPTGIISPPPQVKELSKSAVNPQIVAEDSVIEVAPAAQEAPIQLDLVTPSNKKPNLRKTVEESPGSSVGPNYPPQWVPNDYSNQCMGCNNQFLFLITSKHHCRRCGGLFCGNCSNYKDYVPPFYIDKKVRVCKACHLEKEAERKERKKLFEQHQLFSGL